MSSSATMEDALSRASGGSISSISRSTAGGSSSRSRSQNVGAQGHEDFRRDDDLTKNHQPQQQLSTIEKSVTHLLIATKQLLETLTMWSRGQASESRVSDVYVRLGYEFNIACRAFNAIGVETNDLGPVPDLLRSILEDTLSQEASQASLDRYLPRIRDIIINLLHGLKKKQQRLRQRNAGPASGQFGAASTNETGEGSVSRTPRQGSIASSTSSGEPNWQTPGGESTSAPARWASGRSYAQRQGSGASVDLGDLPPRTSSTSASRTSPTRRDNNLSPQNSTRETASRDTDLSASALSSVTQNIPTIMPYPENDSIPYGTSASYPQHPLPLPASDPNADLSSPHPPPPPPKQNDALTALQRGGELERRASRRFSAYQISKHLGPSANGLASAIPPAQHSPVPNRGRDLKESMSAVRSRGSAMHTRARSRQDRLGGNGSYEPSPSRASMTPGPEVRKMSEEPPVKLSTTDLAGDNQDFQDSPMVKTPEDKLGAYPFPDTNGHVAAEEGRAAATLSGPIDEPFAPPPFATTTPDEPRKREIPARSDSRRTKYSTPPQSQYLPDSSPQAGKELTLFLQYKSKVKKFVLPDGGELTLPRLQLAFIEKFSWNTQQNGVDLPEIYIQDQVSGVRHELEDLADIKERSVLVLNVEALDEVKRHIDDGLGGIRRLVEGLQTNLNDQQSALQLVAERQQDSAKELAGIAATGPAVSTAGAAGYAARSGSMRGSPSSAKGQADQLQEIHALRRDLAVVRQTYSSFVADMNASMATIRSKAASVKKVAAEASVPILDANSGRTHVDRGKKQLSDESEKIVNRVDDLQDLVEDLRKDVVTRGVRPLPCQLEEVSKDISTATAELKKMQEYLRKEKPIWTKIWEKELQVVCDERELLTLQEELAADLEDDLDKAAATFALVEQATKQQNLQNPPSGANATAPGTRIPSRTLPTSFAIDQGADPLKAKDSVLGEVRALQPNHESRLEAIARAEKARQRELESRRGGEFARELGDFVEEGKLRKSGGVEEVERVRLVREEKTRKEVFERQQARAKELAEKRAAEKQAKQEQQRQENTAEPPPETPADGDDPNEHKTLAPSAAASIDGDRTGNSSSPEPVFLEAKEVAGTPSNEAGPS